MALFEKKGSGAEVIFISGLFAGSWIWDRVIEGLPSSGYTISRLTKPLPAIGRCIDELREHIMRFINDEVEGRAVIAGNSLGGLLALDIASHLPDKISGSIISGSPGMGSINLGIGRPRMNSKEWLERLSKKLFVNANCISDQETELTYEVFNDRKLFKNIIHLSKDSNKYDAKTTLSKIKTPVQLIWGDTDYITPLQPWKDVLRDFPQVNLQVIKNSGHSPMLEKHKEFSQVLEDFLARIHHSAHIERQWEREFV